MLSEKFVVQGMTCEGCANKIKKSVSQVEGAELISFDIPAGEVEIKFDERLTSLEEVKTSISESGYPIIDEDTGANPLNSKSSCCKS